MIGAQADPAAATMIESGSDAAARVRTGRKSVAVSG